LTGIPIERSGIETKTKEHELNFPDLLAGGLNILVLLDGCGGGLGLRHAVERHY
jgi:hypothetical protein